MLCISDILPVINHIHFKALRHYTEISKQFQYQKNTESTKCRRIEQNLPVGLLFAEVCKRNKKKTPTLPLNVTHHVLLTILKNKNHCLSWGNYIWLFKTIYFKIAVKHYGQPGKESFLLNIPAELSDSVVKYSILKIMAFRNVLFDLQ